MNTLPLIYLLGLMIFVTLFLFLGMSTKTTKAPKFLKAFRIFVIAYTLLLFFAIDSKAQSIGSKIYEPEQFYEYFKNIQVSKDSIIFFELSDSMRVTTISNKISYNTCIVVKIKPLFDTLTYIDDNDFDYYFEDCELIDFIVMDRYNYFSYIQQ